MFGCQATGMEKQLSVRVGVVYTVHLHSPRSPISLMPSLPSSHAAKHLLNSDDFVHVLYIHGTIVSIFLLLTAGFFLFFHAFLTFCPKAYSAVFFTLE